MDYRGVMVDVSRHFFEIDTLEEVIKVCKILNLNYLHLHLTDDQGWRIELDGLPRLTEIASRRSSTIVRGKSSGISVEGYYSREDIKSLVSLAQDNGINIIPEIDIPGHVLALLAAYPDLSCVGNQLSVSESFGIFEEVLCVGNDLVVSKVKEIIRKLVDMFPSEYIHIGCDEVPTKRWKSCPKCQQKMRALNLENEKSLYHYFVKEMTDYVLSLHRIPIIWSDGYHKKLDERVVIQHWNHRKILNEACKKHPVIISDLRHHYFDYPHGFSPVQKVLKSKSFNNYNIIGYEGTLWTEHIDSREKLFKQMLPRLCVLAEVANGYNGQLGDLIPRLKVYQKAFDQEDIPYTSIEDASITGIKAMLESVCFLSRLITFNDLLYVLGLNN